MRHNYEPLNEGLIDQQKTKVQLETLRELQRAIERLTEVNEYLQQIEKNLQGSREKKSDPDLDKMSGGLYDLSFLQDYYKLKNYYNSM